MRKNTYTPTRKSRCLIIDRQRLWRITLRVALEAAWPAITVETTCFHRNLLKMCQEFQPDIVLLDIHTEKENDSIELAAKLRQSSIVTSC